MLGSIAVGLSPIFVRLSELGPAATAFHRVLWALPLLWMWDRLDRARTRAPVPVTDRRSALLLAAGGLWFVGDLVCWHWSIRLTSVANATLLANLAPIFVALGARLFFGQRVGARLAAGIAVAMWGASMLVGASFDAGTRNAVGDIFGVATAFFFGGYLLTVATLRTTVRASTVMLWTSAVTAAGLLPVTLIAGEQLLPQTLQGLAVVIALAAVSHVGGQGLIAYALGHLPPTFSSLVILIEPLTAAIAGALLLGESISGVQLLGGAIVLAGILAARGDSTTGTVPVKGADCR